MNFFRDLSDDTEGFKDFEKKRSDDDEKIKKYFDECNHKDFISAMLHLGSLLDTIAIYCDFSRNWLQEAIENNNSRSQKRRFNKFVRDLNEKINLEYDFPDDTITIEEIVLFDGELFLFFDKSNFIKNIGLKKISYE